MSPPSPQLHEMLGDPQDDAAAPFVVLPALVRMDPAVAIGLLVSDDRCHEDSRIIPMTRHRYGCHRRLSAQ